MSASAAHFDGNQVPTQMGVIGTLGTADTQGTSLTLPFAVNPLTGAAYVHISGTDINIGGAAGSNVNVYTGTQQTLGTVGTVNGIGTLAGLGTIPGIGVVSNLTNGSVNILSGTITALQGTVVVEDRFSYSHLTGAGTVTVKSGSGLLHSLVINAKSVGGNLTLFDNTAASGGTIAVIDTTLSTTAFVYDVSFTTGLTAAWGGNTGGDVTIGYR